MARSHRKTSRILPSLLTLRKPQKHFAESLNAAVSIPGQYSPLTRYSLAVLISILAIVLKIGLSPFIGAEAPYLFVLPAVLMSTWFGGVGPGILSVFITLISIYIFFIPPLGNLGTLNLRVVIELFVYLLEAALIIVIVHRRNKVSLQMKERAAQQAIVAVTGQFGLEEHDTQKLMDRVVRAIGKILHVDHCSIYELSPDGKSFRLAAGTGWKRGMVRRTIINGSNSFYEGYTLSVNQPVIVKDFAKEKRFAPSEILQDHAVVSAVSIPVSGKPQPFGVLSVYSSEKRGFSKDDINFIQAMANVLATTLERKATQEELELIASLNTELTSSLNPQKSLMNLVKIVVPRFADFTEVFVKEEGDKTELLEIAAKDRGKERILKEIFLTYSPVGSTNRPVTRVLQSGRAMMVSIMPETWEEKMAEDEGHKKLLSRLAMRSLIVVPIKLRSKTIGAIMFGSTTTGRIYGPRDLRVAQEIASRAAVAIDNGRHYREAREAIQARDEFLSIASHELKTPLTSLLLQLESVMYSIKNDSLANFSVDKTMERLESMIGQSKRINRLVNDLLNISLITTGKMKLEKETVDLREVVSEVTDKLQAMAKEHGSTFTIEEGEKIEGKWDKVRLEQVVTNLVTNALKYGNRKPITIQISNSNRQATLVVKDQGIGIPKDKQQAVFDRFNRASNAKKSIQGLGVGLYMVQQIVKAHGGTISVESKPNKGSTFSISLPLK